MKLRLRSFESKQTLKIEAPNSSSLSHLKQILSQTLPNSPSPASIRLSLNRIDELQSDEEESIQSLGIASGDLIFYSLEQSSMAASSNTQNTLPMEPDAAPKPVFSESSESGSVIEDSNKRKTLDSATAVEETVNSMEIDGEGTSNSDGGDGFLSDDDEKSFSVPGFMRKVMVKELGNDSGRHHKLIVTAVHAVLLESGFVGYDRNANEVINGFYVGDIWPSVMFSLSLFYTLPEVANCCPVPNVVLKFQSLGKFINVYGSLTGGGSGKVSTYSVRLNEEHLVPFLNVVWANCGVTENVVGKDGGLSGVYPESEVYNFWRTVKDSLALPLLIDMCEKAGLALPPCFSRLPTDLKLKVLESLSGVELAKISCTSSELRYLVSSDDLWKLKFLEEFGNEPKEVQGSWKKAFARAWQRRRSNQNFVSRLREGFNYHGPRGTVYRRPPFGPQFPPNIIGGEHDIWPHFGNNALNVLHFHANRRMNRDLSPQCHLEGLGEEL